MNAPSPHSGYLRALAITLGGILVAAAVLLAGVLLWRVEIANALGPRLVERQLGVPVQFTVETLSAEELTVTDIRITGGPQAARFHAAYSLDGLWNGRVGAVTLDGLRASIGVSETGVSETGVSETGVSETGGFHVAGLPEAWFAPTAEADEGDGTALPLRPSRLALSDIDIAAETPAGPSRITGEITADFPENGFGLTPETLTLDLKDDASDTALAGTLALTGGTAEADIRARVPLARWGAFLPGVRAATGTLDVAGNLAGKPAALGARTLGGPMARFRRWVARDLLTGSLDIAWSGLTLTGATDSRVEIADNTMRYRIRDKAVEVTVDAPLESRVTGFAARLAPLAGNVPAEWRATLDAVLSADAMHSRLAFAADAPMVLEVAEVGWRIAAPPELNLTAGPAALSIRPGDIDLGDRLLNHRIDGLEAVLDLDALPLAGGTATGRVALTAGELTAQVLHRGASVDFASDLDLRSVALADFGVSGLNPLGGRIELAGRIDAGADRVAFHPAPGGRIALAAQNVTESAVLNAPLDIAIAEGAEGSTPRLAFDPSEPRGTLLAMLPLSIAATDLTIGGRRMTATPFQAHIRHDAGTTTARLVGTDLTLPGDRTTVAGIALDAAWDGNAGDTRLAFDSLSRRGDILLDRETVLDGRITFPRGSALDYAGALSVAEGALTGDVHYALPDDPGAAGRFTFDGAPIRYAPDGLQPGRLSPLFAGVFEDVGGALEIDVDARLSGEGPGGDSGGDSGGGMSGTAALKISDFGFAAGPTQLREATGTVTFDLSRPPASKPDQALSALLIVPGLGRLPVEARFSMTEDARLLIPALSLASLGGALTLTNAEVDPGRDRMTGEIGIAGLNINELTTLAAIDGVSGTGTLVGTIPVVVTGSGIQVAGGLIEAEGAGLLRIDNPSVNAALAGQHQSVQLLLDALKDFHYEDLALTLDLPEGGDGTLGLRLAGSNPDTLEGHPFDININIESDFSNLFAILQQGFAVTNRMLDRFRDQIVE